MAVLPIYQPYDSTFAVNIEYYGKTQADAAIYLAQSHVPLAYNGAVAGCSDSFNCCKLTEPLCSICTKLWRP